MRFVDQEDIRLRAEIEEAVVFARKAREAGVDLVDCSSGGMDPRARVPVGPGYQVPFAARIRTEAAVATAGPEVLTEKKDEEGEEGAENAEETRTCAKGLMRFQEPACYTPRGYGISLCRDSVFRIPAFFHWCQLKDFPNGATGLIADKSPSRHSRQPQAGMTGWTQ